MVFLPFILIFCVWLAYELRKGRRRSEEKEQEFWDYENNANFVRKKDISQLDYIHVPLDDLPFCETDDEELSEIQDEVRKVAGTEILNLTGISNTDLKYQYGAANFDRLAICDQNFIKLSRALSNWGACLFRHQRTDEAARVLEYAVLCKVDVSSIYTTLAAIYRDRGETEKILRLKERAGELNTLMRPSLLRSLDAILKEPPEQASRPE